MRCPKPLPGSGDLRFRKAVHADLESLNRIYNQAIAAGGITGDTEAVTLESRRQWMEEHQNPSYPILMAVLDDRVAGYFSVSPYRKGRKALEKTLEISYYIDFHLHGRGIGMQLMERGLELCRSLGATNLLAILIDANLPSRQLLEKFGFDLWGRLPGIVQFQGREFDHLYLGRRLTP